MLLDALQPAALERGEAVVSRDLPIRNINRAVGTILGSEVTRRYGAQGCPMTRSTCTSTARPARASAPSCRSGITLDAGGRRQRLLRQGPVRRQDHRRSVPKATFKAEDNIIVGNVALYGATSGEAYIRGMAGERFCVRNSGVNAVVEGTGDHGCEYMTGGRVVVLGGTGRNFAAGMSGGVAYVLDEKRDFFKQVNLEMVLLERVEEQEDIEELRSLIENHVRFTGSAVGERVLANWEQSLGDFVRIIPKDYKRMLEQIRKAEQDQGLEGDAALLAAFEANMKELARVGG